MATFKSESTEIATPTADSGAKIRKFDSLQGAYRWSGVNLKQYKEDGTHFRNITRQTLFSGENDQPCELRYFEIGAGGHSTFERHAHTHAVLILRGSGGVLVGDEICEIVAFDLVHVPSNTWHQFRADRGEALGFLCQVPCDRDRPERPDTDQQRELLRSDKIAKFARF